MSTNTIKKSDTILSDFEFLISGPQTVEEVLSEATIREAERRGIEKGKKQIINEIENEVKQYIIRYLHSLREISNHVKNKIAAAYPQSKILDYKTFLSPFTEDINLFIILDNIDFETELQIGLILAEIEKYYLCEKNIFCEILYTAKTESLDIASIKRDYPFSLKI